jgi:pyrroline-5-carboxylate reductase
LSIEFLLGGAKMIGIIGFGKMGEAIAKGLKDKGFEVGVYDVDAQRLKLAEEIGLRVFSSNKELVLHSKTVFVAVKPQVFPKVCDELKGSFSKQLVISIMAGVTSDKILEGLGLDRVVRVMPNTPALVGEGALAVSYCGSFTEQEKSEVQQLLSVMGDVVELDEYLMNAVTALSGSGPAYVFLFLEALEDAGVNLGIPRDMARRLAFQTIKGCVRLYEEYESSLPRDYINMVTSPGGTTIAALKVLEREGFKGIIINAIERAKLRADELG